MKNGKHKNGNGIDKKRSKRVSVAMKNKWGQRRIESHVNRLQNILDAISADIRDELKRMGC